MNVKKGKVYSCAILVFGMASETCAAKLQENGRVTIDKDVRDSLGLNKGDYVMLTVEVLE